MRGLPKERLEQLVRATLSNRGAASGNGDSRRTLQGKVIANIFLEDSTRTRCSFEMASIRLGASVINLSGSGSSTSKGETLIDTALNIEAMGVDGIVLRCAYSGGAQLVADAVSCPVINAGDGRHEHPTQCILDLAALTERFGELEGKTIAIVGDIANSRVARSALHGLTTMGANVRLVGPPTLVPQSFKGITESHPHAVSIFHDLDEALEGVDGVMMLRIQSERAATGMIASDYRTVYGLNRDRLAKLAPHTVVMHPGPVNRGVEIDHSVDDHSSRSLILRQVTMGVAARMAVLEQFITEFR